MLSTKLCVPKGVVYKRCWCSMVLVSFLPQPGICPVLAIVSKEKAENWRHALRGNNLCFGFSVQLTWILYLLIWILTYLMIWSNCQLRDSLGIYESQIMVRRWETCTEADYLTFVLVGADFSSKTIHSWKRRRKERKQGPAETQRHSRGCLSAQTCACLLAFTLITMARNLCNAS